MNLIEQLGGYEKAKKAYNDMREAINQVPSKHSLENKSQELKAALLAYRRANKIFELNDWALTNNPDFSEEPCQLVEDCNYDFKYKTKSGHWGFIVKSFLPSKWRHATDDEIEAGKRLDSLKEDV